MPSESTLYGLNLLNMGGNIASTLIQNRMNRQLAAEQFNRQQQLIHEQNEYNSPSAQMQRYRDAGLNPNLIYGQIGNGNQSQVASYQQPRVQAPTLDLSSIISTVQQLQNIRVSKAQEQSILQDIANKSEVNTSQRLKNLFDLYLLGANPTNQFGIGNTYFDKDMNVYDIIRNSPRASLYDVNIGAKNASTALSNSLREYRDLMGTIEDWKFQNITAPFGPEYAKVKNQQLREYLKQLQINNDYLSIGRQSEIFNKIIGPFLPLLKML